MSKTNVKDFLKKLRMYGKGKSGRKYTFIELLEYPTNNMIVNCIRIGANDEEILN